MKNLLIIGAGTMGCGIAQIFAQSGYSVYINDANERFINGGISKINNTLTKLVSKGALSEEAKAQIMGNIMPLNDIADNKNIDLVIEAITESIDAKKDLFKKLSGVYPAETIFASNTSALSISKIAASTDRPDRFIGIHFFNPVPVMKLVEIIKGIQTSDDTLNRTKEFIQTIGKTGIEVNEAPGFVVNRMLVPLINEAVFILSEGISSAEDIDQAMKLGANHPIGPLALADMIGLDVCLAVMETLHQNFGDPKYRPCPLLRKLVDSGFHGRKSGRGFFEY